MCPESPIPCHPRPGRIALQQPEDDSHDQRLQRQARTALRATRARARHSARRPVLRATAGRFRRGGDQDRASGPGRPHAQLGAREGQRQVALVAGRRPQQEGHHAGPAPGRRAGPAEAAGREVRLRAGEFPSGNDGEMGTRLGAAVCDQPAADHDPRLGIRTDRPLFAAGRFRRDRRGHGRPALRRWRPDHTAVANGHLDRRFARGHFRMHRCARRAAPPREDRARPGGGLGDLRSSAQHDGVAGDRVRQGGLHPRAHWRDPAERRAVECLQDVRRHGADRREPGHGVLAPRRGDGPGRPRDRSEVFHARCARRQPGRARRPRRTLDGNADDAPGARPHGQVRRAGRPHIPRAGNAGGPAFQGA